MVLICGLIDSFLVPNLGSQPRPGVLDDLRTHGGIYFDNELRLPRLLTDPAEQLAAIEAQGGEFPDDPLAFPGWVEALTNRGMDRSNENIDVAPFLPPLRFPADNNWFVQGADDTVEVRGRLTGVEMGQKVVRLDFELTVVPPRGR